MEPKKGPSAGADHLCVFVHGLWGNPKHLNYIVSRLRDRYPQDTLHILQPKSNTGTFTYDGIELGGERVTSEIEAQLRELEEKGTPAKKISVVGYSLGGLIARYSLGLLYHNGWFDKLEPVNFTTFASPHLGVRTPLRGVHRQLWNVLGARSLSVSGRQLFLIDSFRETGRPLLAVLADPESVFMRALARFKNKSLYANIINDRSAVYYTTMITSKDPYVDLSVVDLHYLNGYEPVILNPDNPVSRKEHGKESETSWSLTRWATPSRLTLSRLPFFAFLVIWVPLGMTIFFINAGVHSVRSQSRIRRHNEGRLGIPEGLYRIPLLVQRAGEEMFEDMAGTQEEEFLPFDGTVDAANGTIASSSVQDHSNGKPKNGAHEASSSSSVKSDPFASPTAATHLLDEQQCDFPTLALTQDQFAMIKALDALGWRKYPVHIHKAMHSHAAIIRRMDRKRFEEGAVVASHWTEHFEM